MDDKLGKELINLRKQINLEPESEFIKLKRTDDEKRLAVAAGRCRGDDARPAVVVEVNALMSNLGRGGRGGACGGGRGGGRGARS